MISITYVLDSVIGNFLIVGDLNSEITESSVDEFSNRYDLHSFCHKSTVVKIRKNHHTLIMF